MSSGSYGLTIAQLEQKVTYPTYKKKEPPRVPHRTADSRRLVEEYRAAVAADKLDRQRFAVAGGAVSASTTLSGTAGGLTSKSVGRMATPSPQSMMAAAEAAEEAGSPDDAVGCLLEALRMCDLSFTSPTRTTAAEVNERLGMLHVNKEMISEALGFFTAGIEADPTFSRNYLHRAECFVLLDDPNKAFEEYEKYFKLENPTKSQLVRCGKCALDSDKYLNQCEAYLQRTLQTTDLVPSSEESPAVNDAYAYYNLGEYEEKRGNDAKANEYYVRVCQIDPTFYEPYEIQAESEFRSGNLQMALHLFEALVKIRPEEPRCLTRLADVFERLGEEFSTSVLSCLTKALELRQYPKDREETLIRRGRLLFRGFRQLGDALADFGLCLSSNPRCAVALNERALVYRARGASGDHEAAVADYRALVGLPDASFAFKAEPHQYLAGSAFAAEDYVAASTYFSLAQMHGITLSEEETLQFRVSMAVATIKQGDAFEETYEPRGWAPKEAEKGKKADTALKGFPVASLSYMTVDQWYVTLRDREPTMHNELEYQLIHVWRPFREEVEKKREEMEAAKSGKKPKKGK